LSALLVDELLDAVDEDAVSFAPDELDEDELSLPLLESLFGAESLLLFDWLSLVVVEDAVLLPEDEDRESVTYQPLPLKTMPTGWMILRSVPPQCSQVVRGGSEKLCRFSTTSLQAVQE
jgi:hypothetical protein